MRLLHTSTLKLQEFYGEVIPKYAILSHTWGDEEVSLQELQKASIELDGLEGYRKIKDCCKLAASDHWEYVWIDTCCIDKTSSAELSEAINSMYRWYAEARVCYAYLADVESAGLSKPSLVWSIGQSRWFTRGWTLQELLAPDLVVFYDKAWVEIGTRLSLSDEISEITGIKHHHMFEPLKASVAAKMSWASGRTTTRLEDTAYSLMGLFEVNMPLLYGEGSKAFTRLQHEIVKISDDESIFAWRDDRAMKSGAFAREPCAFRGSGDLVNVKFPHLERSPYTVTHRGLAIELALVTIGTTNKDGVDRFTAALQCAFATDLADPVSIELMSINQHDVIRTSPHQLISNGSSHKGREAHHNKLVYIWPIDKYDSFVDTNKAPTFYVRIASLFENRFSLSETFRCRPQPSFWDKAQREKCMKIQIDLQFNFAAFLFKNDQGDHQEAFAIILIAHIGTQRMDIFIPTGSETLADIVEGGSIPSQPTDRREEFLQYKSMVSAALARRDTEFWLDIDIFENPRSSDDGCDTDSSGDSPPPKVPRLN